MKKTAVAVVAFAVLAGLSAQDLAAQTEVSWNLGVVTDKSFSFDPFLWTTGFTFDVYFTPRFSLAPELYGIIHNFDFGAFFLAPAVLLNFHGSGFFLGGGVTKWWLIGTEIEGAPSSDVAAKLNLGFGGYDVKFTVFVVTPFNAFFKDMVLGATFGFYF